MVPEKTYRYQFRYHFHDLPYPFMIIHKHAKKQEAGNSPTSRSFLNFQKSLFLSYGGGTQTRTGDEGFAVLCLTTWLCRPATAKSISSAVVYVKKSAVLAIHKRRPGDSQAPSWRFASAVLAIRTVPQACPAASVCKLSLNLIIFYYQFIKSTYLTYRI